jgi:Ca2+-binding EF-hand superfamily protein
MQFLDRNHDGELELWELREAFRCLDDSLSEEELTQFMAHLSMQNHSRPKPISFTSFVAFFEACARLWRAWLKPNPVEEY